MCHTKNILQIFIWIHFICNKNKKEFRNAHKYVLNILAIQLKSQIQKIKKKLKIILEHCKLKKNKNKSVSSQASQSD